jgi:hypothetical protein
MGRNLIVVRKKVVVLAGQHLSCSAGDHTDLGQLGPHLVNLEPVETQTASVEPKSGRLETTGLGVDLGN